MKLRFHDRIQEGDFSGRIPCVTCNCMTSRDLQRIRGGRPYHLNDSDNSAHAGEGTRNRLGHTEAGPGDSSW